MELELKLGYGVGVCACVIARIQWRGLGLGLGVLFIARGKVRVDARACSEFWLGVRVGELPWRDTRVSARNHHILARARSSDGEGCCVQGERRQQRENRRGVGSM